MWGAQGKKVTQDCGDKGLAYVEISADPLGVFLAFATAGLLTLHDVEYACAR